MRIIGTNFFGHDSAIFYLDTIKKEIFTISTERITRIKHDDMDIGPILERYPFSDIDYVCHGYGDFDEPIAGDLGFNRILRLEQQKAYRNLFRPTYVKDFGISRSERLSILLREVKKRTGFGVLINTSFNLHGRTIVHTAKDAIQDFLDCNIEELYLEGFRITRK